MVKYLRPARNLKARILSSGDYAASRTHALPLVFRGREGRLNARIIRFLALNGPSLIYSVSKFLSDTSKTRIHYPTINRRMHDLLNQNYLQKAGAKSTKTGVMADLYATTIRGDFAAFVDLAEGDDRLVDLSPSQARQIIDAASKRHGSPFLLLEHISKDSSAGSSLVGTLLVPEIAKSVKNGYLNLEATDDSIMCSSFASVVARAVMGMMIKSGIEANPQIGSKEGGQYAKILLRCVDRMLAEDRVPVNENGKDGSFSEHLTPVPMRWAKELKVFLRLSAVSLDRGMD